MIFPASLPNRIGLDPSCPTDEPLDVTVWADVYERRYELPDRHDRGNVPCRELVATIQDVTIYDYATDRQAGILDRLTRSEVEALQDKARDKFEP